MFKDTGNGETQYCPMCYEWAEKYENLKTENEVLKLSKNEADEIIAEWAGRYEQLQTENESLHNHLIDTVNQLNKLKEAQDAV